MGEETTSCSSRSASTCHPAFRAQQALLTGCTLLHHCLTQWGPRGAPLPQRDCQQAFGRWQHFGNAMGSKWQRAGGSHILDLLGGPLPGTHSGSGPLSILSFLHGSGCAVRTSSLPRLHPTVQVPKGCPLAQQRHRTPPSQQLLMGVHSLLHCLQSQGWAPLPFFCTARKILQSCGQGDVRAHLLWKQAES